MEAGFFSPAGGGQGEGVRSGQPVKSLSGVIGEAHNPGPKHPVHSLTHCFKSNIDAEVIHPL